MRAQVGAHAAPAPRRRAGARGWAASAPRAREPRDQTRARRARAPASVYVGEVLVAQQLDVAPGGGDDVRVELAPGAGSRLAGHGRRAAAPARAASASSDGGLGARAAGPAEALGEGGVEDRAGPRGASTARRAARSRRRVASAASTARQRAVRRQQLADADPRAGRAHRRRQQRQLPVSRAPAAQAPSSTPRSRTRSMSSRTLSATPSVVVEVARRSSASSACAQAIVSPTPGSL